jgi:gliding motility-associated-like protein
MKTTYLYLLLLFFPSLVFSQLNDNCLNAIPLCSNPSFTFFSNSGPGSIVDFSVPAQSNISNPTPNPNPPNTGCLLSGELNPQWLLLTVGNAGSLEFVFGAANSANPQVGLYDWIMWPYTPNTCAGIFNNTLPPIRCNWNGSGTGGTGVASASNIVAIGGNQVNFQPPIQVNACDQFIICISNFSGVNTLVSFQSLGSASLSCNPNCNPSYAICSGASASIVPVNFAGLTNPSFSIQPGGQTNVTGTFVVSPSTTTDYTTFITGLNSNNVVQTTTAVSTVTVFAQPSSVPTTTQTGCTSTLSAFNLNLNFVPASPVPNYTITWNTTPNGVTSNTQTAFSGSITPGAYNATIISAGGCVATSSFVIQPAPSIPVFGFLPSGPVFTVNCASPILPVSTSNSNYNYTWVNGIVAPITGSVANFDNQKLGTWTVTALDPVSNCVSSTTLNVIQDITPPTATLNPIYQIITCTNSAIQTVTTTATSPTNNVEHQFYFNNGLNVTGVFSNSAIIVPPPSGPTGTHTYVIVNLINGCKTSINFSVATTGGFPTYSVTSPIQNFSVGCAPKNVADIVITSAQSSPPGQPVSYTIIAPGTTTYNLGSQTSYTFTQPGTYLVVVRDNNSSCESISPFSIIQNTFAPQISVSVVTPTLSCFVPTVQLVGSSTNPSISYRWLYGTNGIEPGATYTVGVTTQTSNIITGTYTFEVRDLNNECRSTQSVTIYQNIFPPIARISGPSGGNTEGISCKTPSLTLNNSQTTVGSGGLFPTPQGVTSILWLGPSPQPPLNNSPSYLAIQPGTYTMTARDENNGCSSTTVFVVTDNRDFPVVQNPVPLPADTLDCGNQFARVEAAITTTVSLNYEWFSYLGSIKQGQVTSSGTVAFAQVSDTGVYRVVVTNTVNGCVTISQGRVVLGALTSGFRSDKISGYAPLTVTFNNESKSSTGSANVSSIWSFGNGNTQTLTAAQYSLPITQIYQQPGQYTVTLYTSKGAGSANNTCIDSTFKIISVDIPSKLEIPNVFTPNGDGSNDVFFVRMANLSTIKMSIYDRWGNLVYALENSNNGNVEWDGKNQLGKEVAEGTYFYIVTATGKDGKAYDTKGTVSLYR